MHPLYLSKKTKLQQRNIFRLNSKKYFVSWKYKLLLIQIKSQLSFVLEEKCSNWLNNVSFMKPRMRLTWLCLLLVGVALAQDPAEPATTPATTSAAPTTTAAGPTTPKPAEVKPAEPAEETRSAQGAAQGAGSQSGAAAQNGDVQAAGGNETEECEEAWEYLEFLKTNIK